MAWSDPLENAKHEAFAQAVASGKKLSDAYLTVYPTAKRSSAKSGATRLMREIGGRIGWLKEELSKKNVMSREEVILRLQNIAVNARYDADKIRALQQIAEMCGYNQQKENTYINVAPVYLSADGTGKDDPQ